MITISIEIFVIIFINQLRKRISQKFLISLQIKISTLRTEIPIF